MGRGVPVENLSLIHPLIYLSFLVASIAASMAIITSLCGVGFLKKSSPPPPPPPSSDPIEFGKDLDATSPSEAENNDKDNNEEQVKELPLPPAMAAMQLPKEPFISEKMKRVTSERKMPLSLSIKMPRSLSMAKHHHWDHKEEKNKGNIGGKLKAEDSVWMKTIILGDKCVPDEEEDPVLYEGKGKRIAAYHTRKQSAMSGQTSFLDHDSVSLSVPPTQTQTQTQTQDDQKNNNTLCRVEHS